MRQKKNKLVIFFSKERREPKDPFVNFGEKKRTYYDLLKRAAEAGFEIFISSGKEAYQGQLEFCNLIQFKEGNFSCVPGKVVADAVFDRSGGISFPTPDIAKKVLNNLDFKILCADKMLTYDLIGSFMPCSFLVTNKDELQKELEKFQRDDLVVFKPVDDFGGKGILIAKAHEMQKRIEQLLIDGRYSLQQFVETDKGIGSVVEGRHDLRIIIVNGKATMAHVRTPKEGSFLANVAQGGSIKEIEINKIPSKIMEVVEKVQKIIDEKYDRPIYSIDFGVSNEKPYIFELNDQIGFPREDMKGAKNFIESIVDALVLRAER